MPAKFDTFDFSWFWKIYTNICANENRTPCTTSIWWLIYSWLTQWMKFSNWLYLRRTQWYRSKNNFNISIVAQWFPVAKYLITTYRTLNRNLETKFNAILHQNSILSIMFNLLATSSYIDNCEVMLNFDKLAKICWELLPTEECKNAPKFKLDESSEAFQ